MVLHLVQQFLSWKKKEKKVNNVLRNTYLPPVCVHFLMSIIWPQIFRILPYSIFSGWVFLGKPTGVFFYWPAEITFFCPLQHSGNVSNYFAAAEFLDWFLRIRLEFTITSGFVIEISLYYRIGARIISRTSLVSLYLPPPLPTCWRTLFKMLLRDSREAKNLHLFSRI